MGKLELVAETTTGYYLLTFHVLRVAHIQGKPTHPVWLRLCKAGTGEDPQRRNPFTWYITWHCNTPETLPRALSTTVNT